MDIVFWFRTIGHDVNREFYIHRDSIVSLQGLKNRLHLRHKSRIFHYPIKGEHQSGGVQIASQGKDGLHIISLILGSQQPDAGVTG